MRDESGFKYTHTELDSKIHPESGADQETFDEKPEDYKTVEEAEALGVDHETFDTAFEISQQLLFNGLEIKRLRADANPKYTSVLKNKEDAFAIEWMSFTILKKDAITQGEEYLAFLKNKYKGPHNDFDSYDGFRRQVMHVGEQLAELRIIAGETKKSLTTEITVEEQLNRYDEKMASQGIETPRTKIKNEVSTPLAPVINISSHPNYRGIKDKQDVPPAKPNFFKRATTGIAKVFSGIFKNAA